VPIAPDGEVEGDRGRQQREKEEERSGQMGHGLVPFLSTANELALD
jgi:hypothetical protein